MNLYLLFILFFLIIEYLLDTYSKYLNVYALKLELPEEFVGIYDSEKYKYSQKYTIDNSKFSLVVSSINLFITVIFILIGGFNYLDLFLRKIFINNELILGLSYFGILIVLNTIISLPISFYSTFYIEEKYGFNKTSKKLFLL